MNLTSTEAIAQRLATMPAVDGHKITTAPGDHPNMTAVTCSCGYRADAVTAYAGLLVAEHSRIPAAHTNPANRA